ncbi:dTDP-4-dehydrorhamnose 3,5-epimerase family protein, partial [Escherichia coli]|nr:dTDP-4-dehydrorhamnose 3,5-epimerase family protein [Escherichia coli]
QKHERSILWNDKILNVEWPFTSNLILSSKDMSASLFTVAEKF